MPIFKEKKTASFYCPGCSRLTDHERVGENFSAHLPLLFLSCFLWLPVWLVAGALDRAKPYVCTGCGAAARLSLAEGGAR